MSLQMAKAVSHCFMKSCGKHLCDCHSSSPFSSQLSLTFCSPYLTWCLPDSLISFSNPLLPPSLSLPQPYNSALFSCRISPHFSLFLYLTLPQEMQIASSLSIRNAFLMSNKWINTTKALRVCVASMCMWETVWACLCKALGGAPVLKWYSLGCFQQCDMRTHTHKVYRY